jgi:hypothetical protein
MSFTSIVRCLGILAAVLSAIRCSHSRADEYLLVNGQTSQNLVRFDLGTGASSLFATYQPGAFPRNLAIDATGDLFSSLNGTDYNVVKLVAEPGSSVLGTENFTASIGGDGPGQIQFYNGDLYVAGDESRVIFQYDGATGAQVGDFSATGSYNIRAMAITGSTLYYEEAFQNTVREFDLSHYPPPGSTLFQDPVNLAKAINMTIGPQGILVFANANSTLIPEYSNTGKFLGTLADIKNFDSTLTGTWDVLYSPGLQNYFVSAGSEVFRLDTTGNLLQTYHSDLLNVATGLLIVPEPSAMFLAVLAGVGLFVYRRRGLSDNA